MISYDMSIPLKLNDMEIDYINDTLISAYNKMQKAKSEDHDETREAYAKTAVNEILFLADFLSMQHENFIRKAKVFGSIVDKLSNKNNYGEHNETD